MKTPHSEKRQQVWLAAWTAYTGAAQGPANDAHLENATIWADQALKDFDERFLKPLNTKKSKRILSESDILKHNDLLLSNIRSLFPGIKDNSLFKEIKNQHLLVRDIKARHDIIYKTEGDTLICRIVPKRMNQDEKIIPERDTFNIPPEYPNGDDLTLAEENLGCFDKDCLSKKCSPECENLKCNSSPPRETPQRDTNTYLDKI